MWRSLSLRTKLLVTQAAVTVLVLAVAGVFLYRAIHATIYERYEEGAASTVQVFEEMLAEHPDLFTPTNLYPVIQRFASRIANVDRVTVVDHAGRVVADSGNLAPGTALDDPELAAVLDSVGARTVYFQEDGINHLRILNCLEGPYDATRRSQVKGALVLTLHLDRADRELHATFFYALALVTALVLLLLSILFLLLQRGVIRPLQEMGAAAAALGAGDHTIRLVVECGDEVGQLAEAFNRMAAQLGQRQAVSPCA